MIDTGTTTTQVRMRRADGLPDWKSVLAVVAHPDDESFGLGAVLDAFAESGSVVSVLCLTRGEASTVHGVSGDLASLRAAELKGAAAALGVASATLRDYPDGALSTVPRTTLVEEVKAAALAAQAVGVVVFDPSGVTGHADHRTATEAALEAAGMLDLAVLGWTLPAAVADRLNEEFGASFTGHDRSELDLVLRVDRERQRMASLAHASQAVPTSVLWRRLELLDDVEYLRWLRRRVTEGEQGGAAQAEVASGGGDAAVMRVEHRGGDRFAIAIRDHELTVDQPTGAGGDDQGPTPTELFIAGLTSCVAFYARRYLGRHELDHTGLVVDASYRMGAKPARVSDVAISIQVPQELPAQRREGLLRVASHCTVHNSITTTPDIRITLA